MTGHELVRRAIEFERPERVPFFQSAYARAPSDVCDSWELDRQKAGWFFDTPGDDDWGCRWARTEVANMGQVVHGPLEDWAALDSYRPPDPTDPFYYRVVERQIAHPHNRYVCLTSHFTLFERLHMLHGFTRTLEDFYLEPRRIERLLDMILEHKMTQLDEIHRRFGDRVHGIFVTDDWGTQSAPFVSMEVFDSFFAPRYRALIDRYHEHGYHFILHSCGRITDLVERFIDLGVDVMNMQQPRAYPIEEIGRRYRGRMCFLTTVDIQSTLPAGVPEDIREEAHLLLDQWGTPSGGFVVFNYGDAAGIGAPESTAPIMFEAFMERMWLSPPSDRVSAVAEETEESS